MHCAWWYGTAIVCRVLCTQQRVRMYGLQGQGLRTCISQHRGVLVTQNTHRFRLFGYSGIAAAESLGRPCWSCVTLVLFFFRAYCMCACAACLQACTVLAWCCQVRGQGVHCVAAVGP